MSDAPKFEVVDRRKMKAEEEENTTPPETGAAPAEKTAEPAERAAGPRLVEKEEKRPEAEPEFAESAAMPEFPQAPTAEESSEQHKAYTASAQRFPPRLRLWIKGLHFLTRPEQSPGSPRQA